MKKASIGVDVDRVATRKRIASLLLAERLGLDEDWLDPELLISLPSKAPRPATGRFSPAEAQELKASIDRLVALGCRKGVVYWCLGELGPSANEVRLGRQNRVEVEADEDKNRQYVITPKAMTREDMKALARKLAAAAEGIRVARNELLLSAHASGETLRLPSSMLIEPELPEDALQLLLSSLHWARTLALAYQSPNPTALLKSKGVLYLLIYAWLCAKRKAITGSRKQHGKAVRSNPEHRLSRNVVQNLTEIIAMYEGRHYTADDLNDKLQDFATLEPTPFGGLVSLLNRLDEIAKQHVLGR